MRVSYSFLVSLVISLTIFGYPLVGVAVTLLDLPSQALSLPFRGAMVAISLIVILAGIRYNSLYQIDRMLVIFFAAYLVRLIWDWQIQIIDGASDASVYFLAVVLVPSFAVSSQAHLVNEQKLRHVLLILGLIFSLSVLIAMNLGLAYNPWADQGYELDRLMFEALNPISIGRVSGALVLVGLIGIFDSTRWSRWRIIAIAGLSIGLFIVLLANSRGPIAALVIALSYVSLSRPRLLMFIIIVGGGYLLLNGLQGELVQNAVTRFASSAQLSDGSSQMRVFLMLSSWRAFLDSPILGAYYIDPGLGPGFYPHNLFIESAMALGIIGFAVFVLLNLRMLFNVLFRERYNHPTVNALAIYFFGSILFSGSLWGSSEYFLFLALGFALAGLRRRRAGQTLQRR